MITSERRYKDLTVVRETIIACGPDVLKTGHGEEIHTVRVERRCGANGVWGSAHIEIIMPNEPLFIEAAKATHDENPAATLGRKGGSVKSPAKSAAAIARNAKRKAEVKPEGGRPKNSCIKLS